VNVSPSLRTIADLKSPPEMAGFAEDNERFSTSHRLACGDSGHLGGSGRISQAGVGTRGGPVVENRLAGVPAVRASADSRRQTENWTRRVGQRYNY
jgi:hypothetical protein